MIGNGVSDGHVVPDLHESNQTERDAPLKAGMVVTIEPGKPCSFAKRKTRMLSCTGVYVPPYREFPKAFHNIGIRIEVRTT